MSSIINGFVTISLIITIIYFVGLLTFINDYEDNKCEMTYMFEFPQFVRISQEIDEKYPKYGLYAYSEGRFTERSRNMYFDGIPVLFIPGNGGSHRQGRSLASVALRKALNSGSHFYFDYFTIDFNEELTGLNGALLLDQLEYANSSIHRILELYKDRRNQPNSVIIYAHSVGGIIARRLVSSLPQNSTQISIVLTLATPHKRPPLMLDSYIHDFYHKINPKATTNTTFVSISGGYSDFLVASYLTVASYGDSLDLMSTQIPRSWVPSDHVCIVWCKQPILAINRALFDSVDPKTKQISNNPQHRKNMFHHHLVHHNGLNPHLRHGYPMSSVNIRNQGEWVEYLGRQYIIQVPRLAKSPYFYMLRLLNQPQHEAVTVVALNLKTIDWVFVCGAHIPQGPRRVCEEFTHLSHLSELSPSVKYKRRTLRVNLHELIRNNSEWSHVVLRVLPTDEDVMFHVDTYRISDRTITVNLPNLLSFKRQVIIPETQEKAVHYELVVPYLSHVMQSYQLFVEPIQCGYEASHATATLIVPWGYQNQHVHFTNQFNKPLNVRLFESRPSWVSNQSAVIQLTLDPNCRYKISIRSSFVGVLGQLTRFYSPLLIANVAAVILMALTTQMKTIANNRECSLFFVAVNEGSKPYYLLTSVKLLSRFLCATPVLAYLPPPDWLKMSHEGTDFLLLPLLLYICGVGITWLLGIILFVSLVVCETTVHKCALKFLAKTVSFTVNWSDYVMSALHKLPCVVAGGLICLSLTTTGGLALCVGMVFYFMKLTQLSQDYIEELVWFYIRKIGRKFKRTKSKGHDNQKNNNNNTETSVHDAMFFHATIFLLWSLITIINVPSVLTWAHNFKYSTKLEPDPAYFPGLILSICSLPLWQMDLPKIERKGYIQMGHFITVLAVASLVYAPISIFRLNYTVTCAIVVVILHQLVAPNRDLSVEKVQPPPLWYETIKAKLE